MYKLLPILSLLTCMQAWPDTDPVQTCRDAHSDDAETHIACLEAALRNALGAEPRPTADGAPGDPARTATDDGPTGLGAEQLRAVPTPEEAAIDNVQVRIVAARYNVDGMGIFVMADGQVWRETMAAPKRWRLEPDREYDARIERAIMGGYRLHVDGIRGMMPVRRIQ